MCAVGCAMFGKDWFVENLERVDDWWVVLVTDSHPKSELSEEAFAKCAQPRAVPLICAVVRGRASKSILYIIPNNFCLLSSQNMGISKSFLVMARSLSKAHHGSFSAFLYYSSVKYCLYR